MLSVVMVNIMYINIRMDVVISASVLVLSSRATISCVTSILNLLIIPQGDMKTKKMLQCTRFLFVTQEYARKNTIDTN